MDNSLYRNFQMGKAIALLSLQRCLCVYDLKPDNFGFRSSSGEVVLLDFPRMKEIPKEQLFSEDVGKMLTDALLPCIRGLLPDFTSVSYFRAGFVSHGGMIGHALFSNTINNGLSALELIGAGELARSFDTHMLSGYFDAKKDASIPLIGFDEDLKRRGELGQLITKMESEKKLIDQRIKLFLGENEAAENDKYRVTWRLSEATGTRRFSVREAA